MSTLNIYAKYRPVRIGWCIRDGSWDDLRKVLRLTHTLWGGRYNPIIVLGNDAVEKQLIEAFQVDCLYAAHEDGQFKKLKERFPYLPWPIYPDLFSGDSQEEKRANFLDVYHPIRLLYDEYIKANTNPKLSATYFEWDTTDPLGDVFLASFGAYPSKVDTGIDYKELLKNLNGKVITIEPNEPIISDGWNHVTPSIITTRELKRDGHTRRASGIYYGSSSDFTDIVNFWNLRAEDTDVFFYDSAPLSRLQPLNASYLIALRQQASAENAKHLIAAYIGRHKRAEKAPYFPADFDFGTDVDHLTYDLPEQPSLRNSGLMHFKEHSLVVSVDQTGSKPSISFQFPEKPFFDDDPRRNNQQVILSIRQFLYTTSSEEWTFHTPYIPELNLYYGNEVYSGLEEPRVELDGIGIIQSISDSNVTLGALRVRDLVSKIFEVYGVEIEPSRPGLIAARLIQQMGDLQKCRVFKIRGVRKLIESYSPSQSFTRGAAIQTIRDVAPGSRTVGFASHETLYLKPRKEEKLKPEDAFKWLIEHEVFRAGLKLNCPSCNLDFWLSLDNLGSAVACEYCGNQFKVTPQLRDRDWAYRRSGLFGRDDHQEGGIPVVLTLQQLDTILRWPMMPLYTTGQNISSKKGIVKACETDFVLLTRNRMGRLELLIGECKSNAKIPDAALQKDLDNLMKVAGAFSNSNISVYLLFSKTADFTEAELAHFRGVYKHPDCQLILFSRRELEHYEVYGWTENELDTGYELRNLKTWSLQPHKST